MHTWRSSQASTSKDNDFQYFDELIWTKLDGRWWSAITLNNEVNNSEETVSVFIYGSNITVQIIRNEAVNFVNGFTRIVREQMDIMDEYWTQGVVHALKEFYKNDPEVNIYDLKTLVETGLVKSSKRSCLDDDEDHNVVPQKKFSSDFDFEPGSLVWAKYGEHWWSGMVIQKFSQYTTNKKKFIIFWMADSSISEISHKNVIDFAGNFSHIICNSSKKSTKIWEKGVVDTLNELYNYETNFENRDLKEIALHGLINIPLRKNCVPVWIQNILKNNDVNVWEIGSIDKKANCPIFVKEIIKKKMGIGEFIKGVCLACYSTNNAVLEHPLFQGNVCETCLTRLKNTMIIKGDDGIHYFCAVCGVLGLMMLCDNSNCGRAYCTQCISDLTQKNTWDVLLSTEHWLCFLCERSSIPGLINRRNNYESIIQELFSSETNSNLVKCLPIHMLEGKKLRVLSLFDGISSGLFALRKMNIPVQTYYASEIDLDALNISSFHFGDDVTQIGDVTEITERHIKEMSPIHLLLGGSPCNDLSLVNPTRKGLFDCKGSGVLFFEFFRILLLLKKYNKHGFYWLYENVSSMQLSCKQTISLYLQCEPILHDAVLVSAQHRPRLFWGNLWCLDVAASEVTSYLQSVLRPGRTALVPKLRTITTKRNSIKQGKSAMLPVLNSRGVADNIWITEMEVVFGFSPHYTDVGNLSVAQRQRALGKSWSIPVIMHLLRFLSLLDLATE